MKKNIFGIMLALLLVGVLMSTLWVQKAKAWTGTVYVRADGSIDPPDAPIMTFDKVTYTLTNDITSIDDGIVIERSNITLDGNGYALHGNAAVKRTGLHWSNLENVTIRNTNIHGFFYGIRLNLTLHNSIWGNDLVANKWCIELHSSFDNILSSNIVEDNEYGGIRLYSSSNNILSDNKVTAINDCGIRLYSSSNNILSDNNMVNSRFGIFLSNSSGNTLSGNKVGGNNSRGYGIWLDSSYNNTLSGNNVTASQNSGIWLYSSDNNVLSDNNVAENHQGIFVQNSSGNTLYDNNVQNNSVNAIVLYNSSHNNTAFHNSFMGNAYATTDSLSNLWNSAYPSGGNYWSDYNGTDSYSGAYQNETGSDGIGDTRYIIDTNNQDHYPLTNPWIPGCPTAYFSYTPRFPLVSETVTFNASDSSDYEGNIISYEWNFGDGNMAIMAEPIIVHIYTAQGVFSVNLTVTDNEGLRRGITRFIVLDATTPNIETPTREPTGDVFQGQSVKISVNVTDALSGVKNVTLYYTTNHGEAWTGLPMNHTTSNLYEATIPQQEAGVTVRFKIVAYDNAGNNATLDGTETISFISHTSPLFGPGFIGEAIIGATIIIIVIGTAAYFLKIRKRKSKS